jgi:hypothetical protein
MKSGLFSARNLDDPNRLEMAGEIRFCAQRVCGVLAADADRTTDRFARRANQARAGKRMDIMESAQGTAKPRKPKVRR